MANTYNKFNKLMLIKQASIDFVCGSLKVETEEYIMAAQDKSLYSRNYQARVMKNGVDPKCGMCDQYDETVHHLVLLPVIGPIEYKNRHMTESANTSNGKSVNIKKGP